MGFTALHLLLWLLAASTPTAQEMLSLHVTPKISAACGQQVTLDCEVSSSQHGLSIKHMQWYQNNTSYCSVNSEETVTKEHQSSFRCEYQQGRLSLIFTEVQPMESGTFRCKLHSNKGAKDGSTILELQDGCGQVEGLIKDGYPTCTFTRVYPDGEVHWFHGSKRLHGEHKTIEDVEDGGWLTIRSYMERKSSGVSYNCSLWSTKIGRYIASTLVEKEEFSPRERPLNGTGSQGPMRTSWCFTILTVFLLKLL
ncbi:uncharacterized protein LOC132992953 [Labrus mixtus]|uniref:uncharacterized protein LOC132992953 n=1 Tax=Labrus mixtus TaxID=508554 RepID=UPI0029C084D5|nr:uncharacterized protein LOC132992953 [Labrus mixtus]XP_060918551.1 uncharacterized protein LOC132992953 [Labrus mixtus]